jgi:Zn-dependent protease
MDQQTILLLPLWYAVFLLSLVCHEAAHALAAWRGGDPTAYHAGQVSLNPLPHVLREPLGAVVIPILTYVQAGWMMGWASAPYDPDWERRHPRRAAAMAIAGPTANLLLAAIAFGALRAGLAAGTWTIAAVPSFDGLVEATGEHAGLAEGAGRFLSVLLGLNLLLFVFNLMPFPPLDGAGVVAGLFAPARALRERLRGNPLAAIGGLVLAIVLFRRFFSPVYGLVLQALVA